MYYYDYYVHVCRNNFFILSNNDCIGMGGGAEGYAFLLTDNMLQGSTHRSDTFQNDILTFTNMFTCVNIEIWTLQ